MKKERKLSPFRAVLRILPLVVKHSPLWVTIEMLLRLIVAALSAVTVYCNRFFYDALLNLVNGNVELSRAILGAAAVLSVMLAEQLFGKLYGCIYEQLSNRMEYSLAYEYMKKISHCSAQSFENPAFLEESAKASDGVYGAMGMYSVAGELVLYFGVYFVITGVYLFSISPILLCVLLLVFVPTALTMKLQSKLYAEQADEAVPVQRKLDSFSGAALNHRETRMFGAFGYFYRLVRELQEDIFAISLGTEKKNCRITLLLNMTKFVGWCAVLGLMIAEMLRGNITVGAFAAVYQSLSTMFSNCESLFSRLKNDVAENLGMIEDYISFLDMPEKQCSAEEVDFGKGINVQNVSFSYPGSERKALDNVSLSIASGETVAIVGANGSGKTTLSKLLCGLYTPDEGSITIGGADSSCTSPEKLYAKTSAVFQDYMRYGGLTLRENVEISDILHKKDAETFMKQTGCSESLLESDKMDSLMGREFDGLELSGGQWQRIAMARGLYRDSNFILLDEPTAAIDPLEESRIYKMFASVAKDKTCVLVTHRLGSARIADRIIVMDAGHIVETGTHEELLQKKGLYHEMWTSAAEQYVC